MATPVKPNDNSTVIGAVEIAAGQYEATHTNVLELVKSREYNLQTGTEIGFAYVDQLGQPIDGSNGWLRTLSPFTLRVLPPLMYLENPSLLTGQETNELDENGNPIPVNLGIYHNALSGSDAYASGQSYATSRWTDDITGTVSSTTGENQTVVTSGGRVTSLPQEEGNFESAITDMDTAMDMAIQLETILSTPPLTLLINPTDLSITYAKIHQFQERSRMGYIYQAWGEDQVRLSISGTTGAFFAGAFEYVDPQTGQGTIPSGAQFATKRNSASFQNLMALFTFYKSAGYIYDTLGKSNAMLGVGALGIDYDGWSYIGHIESFTWGYTEEKPNGGIEFSMEFVASFQLDNKESSYSISPLDSPIPSVGNYRYGNPAYGDVGNQPGNRSLFGDATGSTQFSTGSGGLTQALGSALTTPPTSTSSEVGEGGFEAPVEEEDPDADVIIPLPPSNRFIKGR